MRGISIRKAQVISDDERRTITEIMNGELNIKNLKILTMKKGEQILGNHKHWYPEVCYVLKGKCHYWLKNKEGEELEVDLNEGELMFRAPEVVHTCTCSEDCVLIDGGGEAWISEEWNHVKAFLTPYGTTT